MDVVVGAELPAQRIGTLSTHDRYVEGFLLSRKNLPFKVLHDLRCLIWEGDWSRDVLTVAAERGRKGFYGKIVLTVCGEVGLRRSVDHLTRSQRAYWIFSRPQDTAGVFDSIRQVQKKCLFPDPLNSTDLSCTLNQSGVNERVGSKNWFFKSDQQKVYVSYPALQITADSSHLEDSVCCGEIQVNKIDTSESTMRDKPPVWPTVRLVSIIRFILSNICIDGMTYLFSLSL